MTFRKIILTAIPVLLAAAIGGFAYLGTFSRMHADDFCIASSMNAMGFFPSVAFWYSQWAGRYMYFISAHLVSLTGPLGAAVTPAILFSLLTALVAWAMLPLARKSAWPHPRLVALAGSTAIVLTLLSTAPNLFQSFLWRDGEINYSFPMIGMAVIAALGLRAWLEPALPTGVYAGLVGLLALFFGGFAETYSAMQVGLMGVCFGLALIFARGASRPRLLWVGAGGLLGALAAFGLEYIAPGNFVRQQLLGPTASLGQTLVLSLRGMLILYRDFVILSRYWALAILVCPFLVAWWLEPAPLPRVQFHIKALWAESWFRALVLIPLSLSSIVVAACAPTGYAMNVYLADRSVSVPLIFLIAALILCSALLGIGLRRLGWLPDPGKFGLRWILPLAILAGVAWMSFSALTFTARQAPDFQDIAKSWDKRNQVLLDGRRQGLTDITVVGLHNRSGIGDLRVETDYWINACMANYYGYHTITGR